MSQISRSGNLMGLRADMSAFPVCKQPHVGEYIEVCVQWQGKKKRLHREKETYCVHPTHFRTADLWKWLKWEQTQQDQLSWRKEQNKCQCSYKTSQRRCRCSLWHSTQSFTLGFSCAVAQQKPQDADEFKLFFFFFFLTSVGLKGYSQKD